MYEEALTKISTAASMRNLSAGSVGMYSFLLVQFFKFTGKDPMSVDMNDVYRFILEKKKRDLKATSINTSLAALHFYFRFVLHTPWDEDLVPHMIEERFLPSVLTDEQVELLLDSATNLKYKAMIALMYSSGLRVSEVCRLDYKDISRSSMQVHVKKTKNRMDHYTILSQRALDILTEYWFECGRPTGILFPSRATKTYITTEGARNAFVKARDRAGLDPRFTCHSLRHSFATHLLEDGVDVRYIQVLLGHRSLKSTEQYLHLCNTSLIGIKSPFDTRAVKKNG